MLLLDEPLGALDLKLRRQMQDELKSIQQRVGTAFVHVTHDQEEAMALADHVVVMNNGRIEDEGPPERVYGHPATRFSATFMGESTILAGRVMANGDIVTALGKFAGAACRSGDTVHVAIRPEHLMLGSGTDAKVTDVVYHGSFKRVTAMLDGVPLLARVAADAQVKPGDVAAFACDPRRAVILRD